MEAPAAWNPLTEWKKTDIDWVRVEISREDLARFTKRSTFKGLCQTAGFLAVFAVTGGLAYYALVQQYWVLLVAALYLHGTFYSHFGDAIHELCHNTVFPSKAMNVAVTNLFGWLYWSWNPHLYRLSHLQYHHRYTLYQGSDGEDTPNYVELTPRLFLNLFLNVFHVTALWQNLARVFTLRPTTTFWRGRGRELDNWEQFVLKNAREPEVKQVHRFTLVTLVTHVIFVAVCITYGLWFLPVLITLAPFYGGRWHGFFCSTHQHAGCDANNPDFRISCGDVKLDPLSSLLYWRMEYHTEHHMFAAIPCYNLSKFRNFVADQLPPRERSIPRLLKLNKLCREKYGSWQDWRNNYGRFKGI